MERGVIKGINEKTGMAIIEAPIDIFKFIKQEIKECNVEYIDSRPLSDKQRRFCYSIIKAIADYTGENVEAEKEILKMEFMTERVETLGERMFSLSNAPMSLIASFENYLIDFVLAWDIPTKFPLREYVNDIEAYVYLCLLHKKCCISGKSIVDLHHFGDDKIGMGNDRNEVHHLGRKALPLSREYHNEIHTIGDNEFIKKWHLCEGIPLDKSLCKLYRLKP